MTINGVQRDLQEIRQGVQEIKYDLSASIDRLSQSVDHLSNQVSAFISVAQHSIPIKAVFWMFLILVLAMVGVEGVKALSKFYHP